MFFAKKSRILFVLLFLIASVYAQTNADFMFSSATVAKRTDLTTIDEYVKTLKIPVNMSYEEAAKKICAKSTGDYQKARAIFAWVAQNISYDITMKDTDSFTVDGVWKRRSGIAAGYCNLYLKLARCVGLDGEIVSGLSKSSSYQVGDALAGHVWLLVHNGTTEILMDPTWAAGIVNGNKFVFSYNPLWFDVDPYIMASVHLPDNDLFQYLNVPITLEQFKVLEPLDPVLTYGGIEGREVYNFFMKHPKASLPSCSFADSSKVGIKARKISMSKALKINQPYVFRFDFPANMDVKISVNGKWTQLKTGIDITVKPEDNKGVMVAYKTKGTDKLYPILWYKTQNDFSFPHETEISNVTNLVPTVTLATANATTRKTKLKSMLQNNSLRLEKDNVSDITFTMTDGRKMNNQADGKAKIIVCARIDSSSALWTMQSLALEWKKMSDVDLIFYDDSGRTKEEMTAFKKNLEETEIQFAYTTDNASAKVVDEYRKLTPQTGSIALPMIVYIDKNNKVQFVEWGLTFDGEHVNKTLKSLN